MGRLRSWFLAMKVFPRAMALGAVWGFFSPVQGVLFDLLWPLISLAVIVYLLSVCLLAGVEAWAGPNNEGQPHKELEMAAKTVAISGPLLLLLAIFYGSPGTVLVAYSVYYAAIQFLSEHRLTWIGLATGWFCVLGHTPAVDLWEALILYPLAAFVTVGLLQNLLKNEVGLRRSC